MAQEIHRTVVRFPEIHLETRDAHKLRGYFGTLFRDQSPLLHNHLDSGELAYRYPMVQYKVLAGVPTLVGINEGAELLTDLFLKIRSLELNGETYAVREKNIESSRVAIGLSDDLHGYRFDTLWMALNQKNYFEFMQGDEEYRVKLLKAVLTGNVLSFYKAIGYHADAKIMINLKVAAQKETKFKDKAMIAFDAEFVTNALLPSFVGIGKAVSRGFGTVSSI
ncbi:CRISPR-associated endonuclease Cas6 [Arcticibacter sp. MXS-1]|uniref:CRISPR-associated endonuclease Cas6 n=1 Tax=Arcticibacter sp. MXS-1 TaxID=3341726 RepID=UPI0035A86548